VKLLPVIFVLFFAFLVLAFPAPASAQCVVTNTSVIPYTGGVGVRKTLSVVGMCRMVGGMSVNLCFPSPATQPASMLTANASAVAVSPVCTFSCSCGVGSETITINSSDGLPVELMEFNID